VHLLHSRRRKVAAVPIALAVLATVAIAAPSADAAGAFPMTFHNCGRTIVVKKRPKRVVAISDDAVNNVAAAGGLKKIVGRAVVSGAPVYKKATAARIARVPVIDHRGKSLSKEVILGVKPDIVIGESDQGVTPAAMIALGIPFLTPSGYCATRGGSDFVDIENDIKLYGRIFGTQKLAAKAVSRMKTRLASTQKRIARRLHRRTAAALYLSPPTLAAYGYQSMFDTQFELLGLRNVFGNVKARYFKPNLEEIVKRNPDLIEVVTYPSPGKPRPGLAQLKSFPGMNTVTAVKTGHVVFLPYAYSSQAPFAVDGLQILAKRFGLLR
jgi:iron complex transport system substrate-binding protein